MKELSTGLVFTYSVEYLPAVTSFSSRHHTYKKEIRSVFVLCLVLFQQKLPLYSHLIFLRTKLSNIHTTFFTLATIYLLYYLVLD